MATSIVKVCELCTRGIDKRNVRVLSGLKATPVRGPKESWNTSGADIVGKRED